jgi:hypothetical protein
MCTRYLEGREVFDDQGVVDHLENLALRNGRFDLQAVSTRKTREFPI